MPRVNMPRARNVEPVQDAKGEGAKDSKGEGAKGEDAKDTASSKGEGAKGEDAKGEANTAKDNASSKGEGAKGEDAKVKMPKVKVPRSDPHVCKIIGKNVPAQSIEFTFEFHFWNYRMGSCDQSVYSRSFAIFIVQLFFAGVIVILRDEFMQNLCLSLCLCQRLAIGMGKL